MVSFQVFGRIKTFQSDSCTVSAGGADGWPAFGGARSSLESRLQEEPALELEPVQFGADQSSPKDKH